MIERSNDAEKSERPYWFEDTPTLDPALSAQLPKHIPTPAQAAREPEAWTRQRVENYFEDYTWWDNDLLSSTREQIVNDIVAMIRAQPPAAPVETPPRAWLEAKAEVDAGWPERCSAASGGLPTKSAMETALRYMELASARHDKDALTVSGSGEGAEIYRDAAKCIAFAMNALPQTAPMFECPDCGADLAIQTHKADCQRSGTHSLSRPQSRTGES